MKLIRAIRIGIIIWALGVAAFMLSHSVPVLEHQDLQANMILFATVIPLVWIGSRFYYKTDTTLQGYKVGTIFLLTAAFLDALITVPLFVIPDGGSHLIFFTDPGFWIIALEIIGTALLYKRSTEYREADILKKRPESTGNTNNEIL